MEKLVISGNGLYGDKKIVEKIVLDIMDEDTGDESRYETIKIIMSRSDFDYLLNLIGKEAQYWSCTGTHPENIGMEIVDVIEEELGIDFTPDDIKNN